MALQNAQYDEIMRSYNRRQLHNKHILDEHIKTAYEQIPRLSEIDEEITSLSIKKARSLLGGPHVDWDLTEEINALSKERIALLIIHGFPEDYLTMDYDCPDCQDTGYCNGHKCSCLKKAAIELLYTQSNIKEILKTNNFSSFSIDYYSDEKTDNQPSPREYALQAWKRSQDFIAQFHDVPDNMFLYGDTGVGKTFLSHCITKELIDQGFCVIYFSAFDLFDQLAKSTFTNDADALEQNELILNCDLLIIDDLGTELTNSFVASSLFLCINERLMRQRSTVISTNLSLDEFLERYSERIFSRISSNYTLMKLTGKDIRMQKKLTGGIQ